MKYMTGNEIRKAYLDFFQSKGHLAMESFSLVPDNDPSLLLIGAGMAPLKPFFTGKLVPPCPRITTSQKSMRTGDLDNVGRTARHQTFFEMLGNFSFGDYFKKEAIEWAWELLTEVYALDKDKLYVTIYPDDEEAHAKWLEMGVPESHITRLEDNFWEIGEGPCGPDSEIFYDQGEAYGCGCADCSPGCDCDRYLEIWNLVFTQFNKMPDGSYEPLAKKNIDTGAGLERLASVLQGVPNNFETDLLFPLIEKTAEIAKVKYHDSAAIDVSLKVVADHIRAVTALIADGVLPSNEGRGYVLRRILRRAVRHGRLLGIEGSFLNVLVDIVVDILGGAITNMRERQDFVKRVVQNEEDKFNQTLDQGLELLRAHMEELEAAGTKVVSGAEVFKLYDTYGFPWELTEEIASEAGLTIDKDGFDAAMQEQRTRAREAREKKDAKVETPDITALSALTLTEDEGVTASELLLIGKGAVSVSEASDGDEVTVIVKATPFHVEGGGQLGDIGYMIAPFGKIQIENTKRLPEGTVYHVGTVTEGTVKVGDELTFEVAIERRNDMARNHTATHLLHAALRKVLGDHVTQAGSLVTPDYLRFDFTHFEPVTAAQIAEVETLVNDEILKASDLAVAEMSMDEAKAKGAMALFGEKYGDRVRVVEVPNFSVELCGGSHVQNTGNIGLFHLLSEGGIGSGVRRVEAITGRVAMAEAAKAFRTMSQLSYTLKVSEEQVEAKVGEVLDTVKAQQKELETLVREKAMANMDSAVDKKVTNSGATVVLGRVDVPDMDALRDIADKALDQVGGTGIVVLAAVIEDKVSFVAKVSKDVVAKGAHAGKIVKAAAEVAGGKGGGRPDMAQAGGKDVSAIDSALAAGFEEANQQLV